VPDDPAKRPLSLTALVVTFAALAIVYRTVGDLTTWSECLTIWPPMLWCGLAVPHLAVLAVRRRGRELATGLAALAVFLAVTVEWPRLPRAQGRPHTAGTRLRVVSWNVAGRMPLRVLETWAPDLCLLQEIGAFRSRDLHDFWMGWQWASAVDPGTLSRWPITRLPTRRVGPWTEPQVLRLAASRRRRVAASGTGLGRDHDRVDAGLEDRPVLGDAGP
jgi:hypothetical protein